MQSSVKEPDKLLPESEQDYIVLLAAVKCKFVNCQTCERPFTSANVYTNMGWRETQITGDCEDCFDKLWDQYGD